MRCPGLKPPAVRGHAAAFRYWFNAFGHSGPYRQSIVEADGQQKLVATGNPMNAPGKYHHDVTFSFRDICQPSLVTSASVFVSIAHKLICLGF